MSAYINNQIAYGEYLANLKFDLINERLKIRLDLPGGNKYVAFLSKIIKRVEVEINETR